MTLAIFLKPKTAENSVLGITDEQIARIKAAFPLLDVVLAKQPDGSDLVEQGIQAEIIMANDKDMSFCHYCKKDKALRWIHNILSGTDNILAEPYFNGLPGLIITNSRGVHGKAITDHVMAGILYFARTFNLLLTNQKKHQWNRTEPEETEGKVLGIIGMGQIGRVLASRAKAFEMTILGVKRSYEEIPFVDELFLSDKIDEVIRRSDYLVLLTPYSQETHNLMNADKFSLMKPTSIFINVSRGKCCDNNALYEALHSRKIAGALIDAYEPEPMPEQDPLWELENVIITPHMAAASPISFDHMIDLFIKNLDRFQSGQSMLTRVL